MIAPLALGNKLWSSANGERLAYEANGRWAVLWSFHVRLPADFFQSHFFTINFYKMKSYQFFLSALMAAVLLACSQTDTGQAEATTSEPTPSAAPESKGVLSITSSTDLTNVQYDGVISELTKTNELMNDWTYHAIGMIQPKGGFSFGVYPNQAALDHRRGIYKDLFPKLGINVAPQTHEVHNVIVGPQPASKPARAFIASFAQASMTADIYANVLKELENAGAGTPSGRIYHVSYITENGVQVIDVWESEEQFKAFGGVLMPILQAKGISAKPDIYPLYSSIIVQ
jgi:hypothetical protein